MSSCEKCWSNAGGDPQRYGELLETPKCTPEEQAGPGAAFCPVCNRVTLHQYTHMCMNGCYKGITAAQRSKANPQGEPK
jgi:hypothetical protein